MICCSELLRAAEAENVWEQFPGDVKYYNDDLLTRIAQTITEKDKNYVFNVFQRICDPKSFVTQKQYEETLLPRLKNAAIFFYIRYKLCNNDAKEFARYLLLDDVNLMHENIADIVGKFRKTFYEHLKKEHILIQRASKIDISAAKKEILSNPDWQQKDANSIAVYAIQDENIREETVTKNALTKLLEQKDAQLVFADECEQDEQNVIFQCCFARQDGFKGSWKGWADIFNMDGNAPKFLDKDGNEKQGTAIHFQLKISNNNETCGTLFPRIHVTS